MAYDQEKTAIKQNLKPDAKALKQAWGERRKKLVKTEIKLASFLSNGVHVETRLRPSKKGSNLDGIPFPQMP